MRRDSPSCEVQKGDASAEHCPRRWHGGNFYRAQNEFIDQVAPRIGVVAVALYHFLCRHSRDDRISRVTVAEMNRHLKCGRTALFAALSQLEQHKAIKRVPKPGSESEYELLDLRRRANPSAWRTGDERPTNGGCSRAEQPIRKARLQDCKTPIPPTPLSKGGDDSTTSDDDAQRRGQEFRQELKTALKDVPLRFSDAFEQYFRDMHFTIPETGPILVEAPSRELGLEALAEHGSRMKQLAKRMFGRECEFLIADDEEQPG